MHVLGSITVKIEVQLEKFLQHDSHRLGPCILLELCPDPSIHFESFCLINRASQTLIYLAALALGLRIPLDPFIQEVCRSLGKPLGPINPNGLEVILGFMALNNFRGCKLTYKEFYHMYTVMQDSRLTISLQRVLA